MRPRPGLTYNTIATGIVFFHRFYMAHSFKKYDRYVVAACALFLAGKVEETPKLCRDLVRSFRSIWTSEHLLLILLPRLRAAALPSWSCKLSGLCFEL
ncbi:hypothetical protein BOX15_Mlig008844g2 [Macrostomum lignano]|uniref:Cyclin-like domain-containing protein n=1 Tax=Macrostomum lignano TaxID=282301 RepID=A0A267DDC7_9PLAT|nr:hypothetical protein BOX15_Mlig008844g2 [Macrostomum lignano]